ncbi:MAG TPA: hypothetical protein VMV19_13510, partial [Xanthobacteraceae bacterium]|nr:hypothetical protein [Xanthobacteraceae bacterium]
VKNGITPPERATPPVIQQGEAERDAAGAPEAALYIASLADELARLAKSHDLEALAYILDMARMEADQISKRVSD